MSVGSAHYEVLRYISGPNLEEPDMRIVASHYSLEVHKEFVTSNSDYLDRLMRHAQDCYIDGKSLPTIRVSHRAVPLSLLGKFLTWLYDDDILRTAMFTAESICEMEYIGKLLKCEALFRACRERSHLRPEYVTWANVEWLLRTSTEYDLPIVRRHLIKFLKEAPAEKLMHVLYLAEIYDVPETWPQLQDLWQKLPANAMGSGFYNCLSGDTQREIAKILNVRKQAYGLHR
ncbi:hypothetical protein HDU87_000931 [Geranomyces variabilis]|uniref:BTB domain-containing protein n=1 Tax=Geranomyces variabilis TaxID=109894 RepID=A0AAD5TBJ3_9FUNG|nr:hypothetical protein HDU87_000931 [Geranomyces variabilis]